MLPTFLFFFLPHHDIFPEVQFLFQSRSHTLGSHQRWEDIAAVPEHVPSVWLLEVVGENVKVNSED